jgi:hypothetical protein
MSLFAPAVGRYRTTGTHTAQRRHITPMFPDCLTRLIGIGFFLGPSSALGFALGRDVAEIL